MGFLAIRCVPYGYFSLPQDTPAAVSTRFFGGCIYGFGISRQFYYTFGRKTHRDGGADANFALQIQGATMQFDESLSQR